MSVSGTLVGIHQRERLVEVNGYEVDLEPAGHLVFVTYEDRPGMVGAVGSILGEADINIAGMQVSRETRGGLALVALRLDYGPAAQTSSSRSPPTWTPSWPARSTSEPTDACGCGQQGCGQRLAAISTAASSVTMTSTVVKRGSVSHASRTVSTRPS